MEYEAIELIEMADRSGYITIPINSSYVEQIAYDLVQHTCVVTINGSDYIYLNVSFHQFYRFVNADSKGSFYNFYVRGRW